MLEQVTRFAIRSPRLVLLAVGFLVLAAGLFGAHAPEVLSAGGFQDPGSESAQAGKVLVDKLHQGDMPYILSLTSPDGINSPVAHRVGTELVAELKRENFVATVVSPWTVPSAAAASLVSKDGKSGLIVAGLTGGDTKAQKYAQQLSDRLAHDQDGITVKAGGAAYSQAQITAQTKQDLVTMESIALPVSFIALAWIFGGLVAAALPLVVGICAIVGTMAILRIATYFTDVSIFALNLTTAMGLALAIDYTLLIISRYRDELADGSARDDALLRAVMTAGRTVLLSALTVGLSLATLVLFPLSFLRSFAFASLPVTALAAVSSVVVAPALIVLLGDRLDMWSLRTRNRQKPAKAITEHFLYRSTDRVMRRAAPVGLMVVVFLLALGYPFLSLRPGTSDDRVLPTSLSSRQVGDSIRNSYADDPAGNITIVVPDAQGISGQDYTNYAVALSQVPNVTGVSAPTGQYVRGVRIGTPWGATGANPQSAFLTVSSSAPAFTQQSEQQLDRLKSIGSPAGKPVQFTGGPQINRDILHGIVSRLPLVFGLIAAITMILLFLLTGSVILPVKALILNVLSLTATFGAMVWIFQEGHFGALGTTATGTLDLPVLPLLFCIAFGLSMDYEVFLLARIREYWLVSGRTRSDSDEAVRLGLARSGRVVTAAALLMAISFAALGASEVSFMRMFGVGLTLAVIVDATLVRVLLVPAFMRIMGKSNWYAPQFLSRIHRRWGINESIGGETAR